MPKDQWLGVPKSRRGRCFCSHQRAGQQQQPHTLCSQKHAGCLLFVKEHRPCLRNRFVQPPAAVAHCPLPHPSAFPKATLQEAALKLLEAGEVQAEDAAAVQQGQRQQSAAEASLHAVEEAASLARMVIWWVAPPATWGAAALVSGKGCLVG